MPAEMTKHDFAEMTKTVLWEEAKGKLRAIVSLDRAQWPETRMPKSKTEINNVVEVFINNMEDLGFVKVG